MSAKKIKILTMHRVPNYGSFLQAYALKKTLDGLFESDSAFLDIIPGKILDGYSAGAIHKLNTLYKKYLYFGFFGDFSYRTRFLHKYKSDFLPLLNVKSDYDYNDNCDLVVIGSDEVFNCMQKSKWGFSSQLFGDISGANTVITYAGSYGHTEYSELVSACIVDELMMSLKNLSGVSVRDSHSYNMMRKLGLSKIKKHLDPVFLYNYELETESNDFKGPKNKYILLYAYSRRVVDNKEVSAIKKIADKKKLKIISLSSYYPWADKSVVASPFEVLSYFQNAEFVVTDTFHGVALSIKFLKRFAVFSRESNKNKVLGLLKDFNLLYKSIDDPKLLYDVIMDSPDKLYVEGVVRENYWSAINYFNSFA